MVERYYNRNRQLIAACEIVHAFISQENGLTGGTRYEVRYAKRLGKDLYLHWESGRVEHIGQRLRVEVAGNAGHVFFVELLEDFGQIFCLNSVEERALLVGL